MRTILFELPFKRAETPSLGLTLLRDLARARGHRIDLVYANLDFEARIGAHIYERIQAMPSELLFGDLVFVAAAFDRDVTTTELTKLAALARIGDRAIESDIIDALPELQTLARDYVQQIADRWYSEGDIYGFSAMFQITPSLAVAKALKARHADATVILGGPHCAGSMGRALLRRCRWIDFVCSGEGETAFPDWLDAMSSGVGQVTVPGVVSRHTLVCTEPGMTNLDALPVPTYEDWREQRGASVGDGFIAPFETSRGCWFGERSHCIFCGLNGEMMTFRSKSPARVLAEIDALHRNGATHLEAADLILNPDYLSDVFPELARRNLGVTFFFETKSTLTRHQLVALRDAGVVHIQPGIESLSAAILRLLRKGAKPFHNVRLLKWCAELGISVSWNFLVGVPGETANDYVQMHSLLPHLLHLQAPAASIRPLRVDRFSPLWNQRHEEGRLAVAPAPAYEIVYGGEPAFLAEVAYHFQFIEPTPSVAFETGVAAAIDDWCNAVGHASLTWCRPTPVQPGWVCDGRSGSLSVLELNEVGAFALDRCDAGVTRDVLLQRAPYPETEVMGALDTLVASGAVVDVDNRFLALPVDVSLLVGNQPHAIAPALAHTIYCSRMATLCAPLNRVWPREAAREVS